MLRAMRDGAKTGILKYFLLGALVLAGGGLVLREGQVVRADWRFD